MLLYDYDDFKKTETSNSKAGSMGRHTSLRVLMSWLSLVVKVEMHCLKRKRKKVNTVISNNRINYCVDICEPRKIIFLLSMQRNQ